MICGPCSASQIGNCDAGTLFALKRTMIREGAFGRGSFDMLMMSFGRRTMLSKAEPFSRMVADVHNLEAKDTFTSRVRS